jgi:predicted enzyme related to lactoylglutathione lyase
MSKKKDQHIPRPGLFCWNELVTTNVPSAKKFYHGVLGWKTQPFAKSPVDYTHFKKGNDMAGGLMKSLKPGVPAHWVPYVMVEDVDATAKKAKKLKGKVVLPPCDIPTVGRIAVLLDPQGAAIGIFKPE